MGSGNAEDYEGSTPCQQAGESPAAPSGPWAHLSQDRSGNAKTGRIFTSITEDRTCGDCPIKAQCYANGWPLRMHWARVSSRTMGAAWDGFCRQVRERVPAGELWRHNQAGELPCDGDEIDGPALALLVAAQSGRRGFTYTHKPLSERNVAILREVNAAGFTISVSCETPEAVDRAMGLGLPATIAVPEDWSGPEVTPEGRAIVQCPATTERGSAVGITCKTCGLCAKADRRGAVAFPAHGQRSKRLSERLTQLRREA